MGAQEDPKDEEEKESKEIKERIEQIKPEFSEYIIEDSFEYVPYETGKLAESAHIDNKGNNTSNMTTILFFILPPPSM